MEIFDFENYKFFLDYKLGSQGIGRGSKSELARFLGCQSGFISQVLKGDSQFSLEHAVKISKFLHLPPDEEEFFILLVQLEKAGTTELKNLFQRLLSDRLEGRQEIKKRLKIKGDLSAEEQAKYYSQWIYAAVHVAVLVPEYRSVERLSKRLRLEPSAVTDVLDDLMKWGLISKAGSQYVPGSRRLHIEKSSPNFLKHQQNWHLEALKSLDRKQSEQFHYSGVLAFAVRDEKRVRDIFLRAISEMEEVIRPSAEEEVFVVNMDLFKL